MIKFSKIFRKCKIITFPGIIKSLKRNLLLHPKIESSLKALNVKIIEKKKENLNIPKKLKDLKN